MSAPTTRTPLRRFANAPKAVLTPSTRFRRSGREGSKRKHRLLAKYLVLFSSKVGSRAPEIYCVDGFAGRGQYDNGDDGSPLLIARIADDCSQWSNPISLKLVNVEANRKNHKKRCEVTEPWVNRGADSQCNRDDGGPRRPLQGLVVR